MAKKQYELSGNSYSEELAITGLVGRAGEIRFMPSGVPTRTISVSVKRFYGASDEVKERTTWFRVQLTNGATEKAANPGDLVHVVGTLQADENGNPRIWTGSDGQPAASFEVFGSRFTILARQVGEAEPKEEYEDIPF